MRRVLDGVVFEPRPVMYGDRVSSSEDPNVRLRCSKSQRFVDEVARDGVLVGIEDYVQWTSLGMSPL